MTEQRFLWEDIKSPEQFFDMSKAVCGEIDSALNGHLAGDEQTQTLRRAKALIQTMCERLKIQSEQMINLSGFLYKRMPEEELLEVMLSCGITRSEMAACWDVPAQDALDAELRLREKEKEET